LQAGAEGRTVLLATVRTAAKDALAKVKTLPGVDLAREMPGSSGTVRMRIETGPGADVREDFFRMAVREDWVILEMLVEAHSLEDVFHKLTVEAK
jgi:hypothetical protein